MTLKRGDSVTLGAVTYTDLTPLGSGAVAEAYAATAFERRVAVKLLGEQWKPDEEEAKGLRHEAEVLRILNVAEDSQYNAQPSVVARIERAHETALQRVIVALFDDGLDEKGRPYVVQELAPPRVELTPVTTPEAERRVLQVLQRVAQGMALAHRLGFALRDFEPHTKLDRVRVRWQEGFPVPQVCLIDWNITGGSEDFGRDLLYLGGHAHHLLLGRHVEMESDGRPPHALGLGIPAWNILGEGSRMLLKKLLHRDPLRRYRTSEDVEQDFTWLLRSIELAQAPSQIDRLRSRAYEARGQERYDRLLALTELVLRLPLLPDFERSSFETLRNQAREEMEKEIWQPIAMARVGLGAGQYHQAAVNFERALLILDARDEPARLARYLKLQAQVGQALKEQGASDPRQLREWTLLNHGIQQLIEQSWKKADDGFRRIADMRPDLANVAGFRNLQAIAAGGVLLYQAAEMREDAKLPQPFTDPHWLSREGEQLAKLKEAAGLLETAAKSAPNEPYFEDALHSCQREVQERQKWLGWLTAAERAMETQSDVEAVTLLRRVIAEDPRHGRALYLLPKAESLQKGRELCDRGEYAAALEPLQQARRQFAGDLRVEKALELAEAGAPVERKMGEAINQVHSLLKFDFGLARRESQQVQAYTTQTLGELSRRFGIAESLSEPLEQIHFVLSREMATQLASVLQAVEKERSRRFRQQIEKIEAKWNAENWQDQDFAYLTRDVDEADDLSEIEVEKIEVRLWRTKITQGQENYAALAQDLRDLIASTEMEPLQRLLMCQTILVRIDQVYMPPVMCKESRRLHKEIEDFREQRRAPQQRTQHNLTLIAGVSAHIREAMTKQLQREATQAFQESKFEQTIEVLTLLESIDPRLGSRQASQMEISRDALARFKEASELLRNAYTPVELKRVLSKLHREDKSTDATELRKDVARRWRQLVHTTGGDSSAGQYDLRAALSLAREGIDLLEPYGVSASIAEDRSLLEAAERVEGVVTIIVAEEVLAVPEHWDRLGNDMQQLTQVPTGWRSLGSWADQQKEQATIRLRNMLTDLVSKAETAIAENDFDKAIKLVEQGQSFLTNRFWQVELAEQHQRLKEIALAAREGQKEKDDKLRAQEEATGKLQELLQRLRSGSILLGSADVASTIEDLRAQPLSSAERRTLDGIDAARNLAAVLASQPASSNEYADAILSRLQAQAIEYPEELDEPWLWQQFEAFARQRDESCNHLVSELAGAIASEADSLLLRDHPDVKRLTNLYWQGQLVAKDIADNAPELRSGIDKAGSLVNRFLRPRLNTQLQGRAWPPSTGVSDVERAPDIEAMLESLEAVGALRQGLSKPPEDDIHWLVGARPVGRAQGWPSEEVVIQIKEAIADMSTHQKGYDNIARYLRAYRRALDLLEQVQPDNVLVIAPNVLTPEDGA